MDRLNAFGQVFTTLRSGTGRTLSPSVKTTPGSFQHVALRCNRPDSSMLLDELVFRLDSLTKKAVAFFKISRSIRSRSRPAYCGVIPRPAGIRKSWAIAVGVCHRARYDQGDCGVRRKC